MERNNELKEIFIKNCMWYYFSDIMRVGDFAFDNILSDEKSHKNTHKNIYIYDISYNFLWVQNHCVLEMFFWEYSLIINKHNQKLINMFKTQMLKFI